MASRQVLVYSVLFVLFLAGCATPVSNSIKASEAQIARYSNLSALEVVAALEKNVNEAMSANMPFLAPHYFREASQVLSECQSALGNKSREVLANKAAKADAILEKGRAVMAIVQYRFAKELELKTQLDKLDTSRLLPREYEKIIGRLSGLIEVVEREKTDNIDKDKDALLKAMQDLEIKAVQEAALHESEIINAESRKKYADKQAPATFAEALHVYKEAREKIAAAHRDEQLVQRLGAQALFAARHAQQVNERVAFLQSEFKWASSGGISLGVGVASGGSAGAQFGAQIADKPSGVEKGLVEKIVLQEEDRLLGISIALGHKDLRDLPLEKQVDEIKRVAGEIARQSKGEANTGKIQDLEARLKAAGDATRQAMTQLAEKDQQLAAKEQQMGAQAAQLAEKDAQIKTLNDKVAQLEGAIKPATKPAAKPKAPKPKKM